MEMVFVSKAGVSYRLNNASKLECTDGRASQERGEEEMIARTYNNHIK